MPEGAARTIQEDSKTKTHPLINYQFSIHDDRLGRTPSHAERHSNSDKPQATKQGAIFTGSVSCAMYPSKLMQLVIGILYGVLNNNYWLVLNVLNVPNSTVAKRTMLKETSNK